MKTLETWVFRIADSDATWIGLGWLRPAKHRRIGFVYILLSSVLLGLPGMIMGTGLIYFCIDRVPPEILVSIVLLVLLIELMLHSLFAHYWNRRAIASTQNAPPHFSGQ